MICSVVTLSLRPGFFRPPWHPVVIQHVSDGLDVVQHLRREQDHPLSPRQGCRLVMPKYKAKPMPMTDPANRAIAMPRRTLFPC